MYQVTEQSIRKVATFWTCSQQTWPLHWLVHWTVHYVTLELRIHSAWIFFQKTTPSIAVSFITWSKAISQMVIREKSSIHVRVKEILPVWIASIARLIIVSHWIVVVMASTTRKLPLKNIREPGICKN